MVLQNIMRIRNFGNYSLLNFLSFFIALIIYSLIPVSKDNILYIILLMIFSFILAINICSVLQLLYYIKLGRRTIILNDNYDGSITISFDIKGVYDDDVFYTDRNTYMLLSQIPYKTPLVIRHEYSNVKLLSYTDKKLTSVANVSIGEGKIPTKLKLKYG